MFRLFLAFLLLLFSAISIFGQQPQTDSISLIADSIVYEIDTIKTIDTINHFLYGAPIDYNVIGVRMGIGKSWFDAKHHQNPQNSISPELFIAFNRRNTLFSIGIQSFSCNEKIRYDISNTIYHDTSFQKIDTIGEPYFIKYNTGRVDTIYITKPKTYQRTDSIVTNSEIRQATSLKWVSIPFRFGYYLKNGFLRINTNLGIVPSFLVSKINNLDSSMLSAQKRFSILVQPEIEVTYWLFSNIFVHISCSYQRNIIPLTTFNGHDLHINSVLANFGFSFLFFDKKRE